MAKQRKFADSVVLYATAGNGGNGSASFRREKYVPRGGPDGGDGGRGGHVILRADPETDSLLTLYFSPHQRAEHGGPGRGKQLHGKNGADMVIKVPCGTEVHLKDTGELLADIVVPGAEVIVARGGKGGRGNVHWKRATHQAPTEHTNGDKGEDVELRLELKVVADVGLVGFPNAGKSSLLTRLSDAHPRIGAYPFTTLNPIIGTIIFEDYSRLRVADIPGLIEGAHAGAGLGDAFLRHIERSRFMVFVLDMAGTDGRKPEDDYTNLLEELELYRAELLERPRLLVANKMDAEASAEHYDRFVRETGLRPLQISATEGRGITGLREAIHTMAAAHPSEAV